MKGVRPSSRAGKSRPDLCTRNQEFLTLGSSAVHSVAGVLGSPTREGFQWNLARVSCGTRSPTRRWSPHPGCLPPLSLLDRRGTPRVVGSWILEAVNPSTTWKCRALVDKEIAVSPGGVPCLSSLPPACRLSPHFLQRPSRLSLRSDQKFKLLPRTSLATVEALGGPGRRRGIASPVAIRRGEGAQRKRCRDAWEIPWTEEPGGLPSVVLQRVGQD